MVWSYISCLKENLIFLLLMLSNIAFVLQSSKSPLYQINFFLLSEGSLSVAILIRGCKSSAMVSMSAHIISTVIHSLPRNSYTIILQVIITILWVAYETTPLIPYKVPLNNSSNPIVLTKLMLVFDVNNNFLLCSTVIHIHSYITGHYNPSVRISV